MAGYHSSENSVILTAPQSGTTAGTPIKIGTVIVVPTQTVEGGEKFNARIGGVSSVPKAAGETWTPGSNIYFDESAGNFTTTAAGNHLSGAIILIAQTADETGVIRLDVAEVLSGGGTATTPRQVIGLSATAGNEKVDLSWEIPGNGGSPIISYTVYRSTSSSFTDPTNLGHTGITPTYTDTTVTNGTVYYYKVRAHNTLGSGTWSETATATPIDVETEPAQVTGLSATPGNTQVGLSWSAPADGGSPITGYTVQRSESSNMASPADVAHAGTATTVTASGLTNGTPYYFRARADNNVGAGPWSLIATATPVAVATVPAQVTGLSATPGNTQVELSWSAPADGGSPITGYTVQRSESSNMASPADVAHTGTATTVTASGLTNGTPYYFRARADNNVGAGIFSTVVSATPVAATPGVPGPPTWGASYMTDNVMTVIFNQPANIGASTITHYKIEHKLSTSTTWTATTIPAPTGQTTDITHNVTSLVNGKLYNFRIAATNGSGTGPYSTIGTAATAEVSVTGHWILGDANPDMLSVKHHRLPLVKVYNPTVITTHPGYIATPEGQRRGLKSHLKTLNKTSFTIAGVFRIPADLASTADAAKSTNNSVIMGDFSSNAGVMAFSLWKAGSPNQIQLLFNARGTAAGGRHMLAYIEPKKWYFVAVSMELGTDDTRIDYLGNKNTSISTTHTGVTNFSGSGDQIAIDDNVLRSNTYRAPMNFAELIIYTNEPRTLADIDTLYANSTARMAAQGLTLE